MVCWYELKLLPYHWRCLACHTLMDDVHLLTARHFRYELRRGGKIFSSKFGAREVCIAPQAIRYARGPGFACTRPTSSTTGQKEIDLIWWLIKWLGADNVWQPRRGRWLSDWLAVVWLAWRKSKPTRNLFPVGLWQLIYDLILRPTQQFTINLLLLPLFITVLIRIIL